MLHKNFLKFRGASPPEPPILNIYVKFALYRIISLQPFNFLVVKPNKFDCFHISVY